MHLKPFVVS